MSATEKITPIRSISHADQKELTTLQNSVNSLRWKLYVPFVGSVLGFGFRAVEGMCQYHHKLDPSTVGARVGCSTVGELVTKSQEEGGLGLSWLDWTESVRAFIYHQRFKIPHQNKQDILREYREIRAAIESEPKDAIEYHRAKEDLKLTQEREIERRNNDRVAELLRKNQSLSFDNESLNKKKKELEGRINDLSSRLDSAQYRINEMAKEKQSAVEAEGDLVRERVTNELSSRHQEEIQAQTEKMEEVFGELERTKKSLSELKDDYQSLKYELSIKTESEQESATLIQEQSDSIAHYEAKVEGLYGQISSITEALNTQELSLSQARSDLEEKNLAIESYESEVQRLKNQISDLVAENDTKDSHLSDTYEELAELGRELEDLRAQGGLSDHSTDRVTELERQLENQNIEIESLSGRNKELEVLIERFKKYVKELKRNHAKTIYKVKSENNRRLNRILSSHRKNLKKSEEMSQEIIQTRDALRRSLSHRFILITFSASAAIICLWSLIAQG